jgi:hypothetical protein
MTSVLPPHSMYTNAAIHFTDPFAARESTLSRPRHHYCPPRASWASHSSRSDFNRALTPPPDMNGISQSSKPGNYQQEHARHYNDYTSRQSAYKTPVAPYSAYDSYGRSSGVSSHTASTRSNTLSPASQSRQTRQLVSEIAHDVNVQSRKPSQNAIAPSFQIPATVNNSGGSLSELAAQITCLFWFESSDFLRQVEDSPVLLTPPRNLVKDAVPTTGFRK